MLYYYPHTFKILRIEVSQSTFAHGEFTCSVNTPEEPACAKTSLITCVIIVLIIGGGWTTWEEWGTCSVTCGDGFITYKRTCEGDDCDGNDEETRDCNLGDCPGRYVFIVSSLQTLSNKRTLGNTLLFSSDLKNVIPMQQS